MKKILLLNFFIVYCLFHVIAQHEGIERHFDTYLLNVELSENNAFTQSDTVLGTFHEVEAYYKADRLGGMRAGNIGHAYRGLSFFELEKGSDFIFQQPYLKYTTQHNEIVFYDARKPFSVFKFTAGPNKYEDVLGLFTANLNPFLNVGARYRSFKTDGDFINSATKVKDFTFWTSYTKKRYQLYFTVVHNAVENVLFGGIASDSAYVGGQKIPNLSVNLSSGRSKLRHQQLNLVHEYRLGNMDYDTIYSATDTIVKINHGGKFSLYHDLSFGRDWRFYSDDPKINAGFYELDYRNADNTYDSISQLDFTQNFALTYKIKHDSVNLMKVYGGFQVKHNQIFLEGAKRHLENYKFVAKLYGNTEKLKYYSEFNYGLLGRLQGDVLYNAQLVYDFGVSKNHQIQSDLEFTNLEPSYYYQRYVSNYKRWDNNFDKELALSLDLSYCYKPFHLKVYASVAHLNNYIYMSENLVPAQYKQAFNVARFGIDKVFRYRFLGFKTQLEYQYLSDNTAIHLPEAMGLGGLFFENAIFDKHMQLRVGVDVRYYSQFISYQYDPITGLFALQNSAATGSSPLIDAYASFKVKRFRAFVRYSNIGQSFLNFKSYSLLYYPDRPGGLHFGISWEFYD